MKVHMNKIGPGRAFPTTQAVAGCLALVGLLVGVPTPAQSITMDQISQTLAEDRCPSVLQEVREMGWEEHCGPRYYEVTHEMNACRREVNGFNRQIKEYNRRVRACRRDGSSRFSSSGGSGRTGSTGAARSSGGSGGQGTPAGSCFSMTPVFGNYCDGEGYDFANNCSGPVQFSYVFIQRSGREVPFSYTREPGYRSRMCVPLGTRMRVTGKTLIGPDQGSGTTARRGSPSSPPIAESIDSTETKSRYCSVWSGEDFDYCFQCPNKNGKCWNAEEKRRHCLHNYQSEQRGGPTRDYPVKRACRRVGWWPPG